VVRPLRSKVAAIQYLQYVSPTTDVDRNFFRRRVKLCMAERVGIRSRAKVPSGLAPPRGPAPSGRRFAPVTP
jgi:hypothetical protein